MGKGLGVFLLLLLFPASVACQDGSFAILRVIVSDAHGNRIERAQVALRSPTTGFERVAFTDQGLVTFDAVLPGTYELIVSATGMTTGHRQGVTLNVGAIVDIAVKLRVGIVQEKVVVTDSGPPVETQATAVSEVIDERAVAELPLNGRRFADLALLTPAVTQDPRGLTSSSNGDLAFGGVRGLNTTFLVDGSDNNNGFFAQARGRYRAPYQFSNETIQEFRVSSNTSGVELGRSAGAVISVITKSGTNFAHGSLFYYLRDGRLGASHPFVGRKFPDQQHQFGFSLGGPIRRRKLFFFTALDLHRYDLPSITRFEDGSAIAVPSLGDFEETDRDLVFAAAARLSREAGDFRTALDGHTGLLKLDANLSPRQHLTIRYNRSRFSGENNVFFDEASPVRNAGRGNNGTEMVLTRAVAATLAGVLGHRWTSQLRAQFSRDDQSSDANSAAVDFSVRGLITGVGRSSLLPRQTDESRTHLAGTVSYQGLVHAWKMGVDASLTRTGNYFPLLFGGRYFFDEIRVNPFTFAPQTFGLRVTPLRAYAHGVPRRYQQNFGKASSHPHSNELAVFVQDTLRLGRRIAFNAGIRYDAQWLLSGNMEGNPLWPQAGKLPFDGNNLAPRIGLAATLGNAEAPIVLRGGFGLFYARIPQIYSSAIETQNGINRQSLRLDQSDFFERQAFPTFPEPLVNCPPAATVCIAPEEVAGFLTTQISSFHPDFQTPYSIQSNVSLEKEVWRRTAISLSFLYVSGKHLIRAQDVNLPDPVDLRYPVLDDSGGFNGEFMSVDSFSEWLLARNLECPFPPCIRDLARPIAQLGPINEFRTVASSLYHGFTLSARRRMTDGVYFRLGYTWAHAIDTAPDSLLIERSSQVQNAREPQAERARSVTDQRHRITFAATSELRPISRSRPRLSAILNDWKLAGIFAGGSGRPLSGRIEGDANRDGNFDNDRLPGTGRNAYTGPDYLSCELRVTRRFNFDGRWKLETSVETFNAFNRNNKRIRPTDDGFAATAGTFTPLRSPPIQGLVYPGYFRREAHFLEPNDAYAPRQVQFSVRLKF